jgi:hypothetical protein
MDIPADFIQMVQILFQDAQCSVSVNGAETWKFSILRGVRQGCPLAPYLFIFIGEALNTTSKQEMELGTLMRIQLANSINTQLMV